MRTHRRVQVPFLTTAIALSLTLNALGQATSAADLTAAEWSRIQRAREAAQHRVSRTEAGYEARNPGQRWTTHFDGTGFLVEPDSGAWTWGLELVSYGFAGGEVETLRPIEVHGEGARVEYRWDQGLSEWYVNDARGIEHGYTVHRRHTVANAEAGGPLRFELAVRGSLRPEVLAGGRNVRFVDEAGGAALSYAGLVVYDAGGQELDAHFESIDGDLRLAVDEAEARYPITIDPIAQQAYIKCTEPAFGHTFGEALAASGDTIVIGCNEHETNGISSGAAFVFVRSGTTWAQEALLLPSVLNNDDRFGAAVAASGDTIVVGAPREASCANGVNGNENNNSCEEAGAAYVFVRNGTTWTQQAYLKASNSNGDDEFGGALSICGDTILVGARWEESSATGVDGDQQDNSLVGAGAAYVFVRNGTTWSQQAYLKASNTEGVDYFGSALAISDDLAIISAPLEDSASPGVNGDETDNGTYLAGAAYVFARNGSTWSQEAYLKPSSPEEYGFFGYGVAASGETVVVGEPSDPRGSGEAHVFVRDDTGWSEESCLPWTDPPAGNYFGRAVDIEGDLLVVGSVRAYGNAGSAAVFTRQGSDWTPGTRLRAANADPGDSFGNSTAILSETTVVVGARLEDSGATGVNGDPTDNSVSAAGAVYVFDLDPQEIGTRFCTPAVPNSSGQPGTMRTFGRVQTVESNLTLAAENLPTNSNVGYFIMGTGTNTFTPPGSSGPICVTPGIKRFLPPVSNTAEYAGGFVRVVGTSGPVSSWITPGSTWSFQAWHRDSAASTSNMTDAVSVTFQ